MSLERVHMGIRIFFLTVIFLIMCVRVWIAWDDRKGKS
jgi:hypothetical protein